LLDYFAPHIKYFIGVIFDEFTTMCNVYMRCVSYNWEFL